MQLIKIVSGIFFILLIVSCNIKNEKVNQLVGIEKQFSYKGFSITDTVLTHRLIKEDSIIYITRIPKKNHVMEVYKLMDVDSILKGEEATFRLIKSKNYNVDDVNYVVYKYLYDEIGIDEEEDVFFTKEYGIIYNRLWWFEYGSSYEYDSISTKLVRLITSDTTGFFKEIIAPPPPLSGK